MEENKEDTERLGRKQKKRKIFSIYFFFYFAYARNVKLENENYDVNEADKTKMNAKWEKEEKKGGS